MIFTPRGLPCKTDEIRTGDTVMVAYLTPPYPGKEAFGIVRVGLSLVAEAIDFLMVDTVHLVSGMKCVPGGGFIGIQRGFRRDAVTNEGQCIGFVAEHAG